MSLTGRITPTAAWPAYAPTWTGGEAYDPTTQAEHDQAIFNALRVLQLGNLDLTERAYSTASSYGFGDAQGSILSWAGKIRVVPGLTANRAGHRDMVGGDWTTEGTPNVSDSWSYAAVGTERACQSYREHADYDSMQFFDAAGTMTGESHPTGNTDFGPVTYSVYSGLFVLLYLIGSTYYVGTTPGSGATPTWTLRHTWGSGDVNNQIAADPTGRYILATGTDHSYMSQDGGVTWTETAVSCDATAIVWDPLNSRWLRAHDTELTWNTTEGILTGVAWTARYTFGSNCTSFISLPGGLLLARLSSASAYYSENAGLSWTKLADAVGVLKYCGGYVAAFQGPENTYISRRVG